MVDFKYVIMSAYVPGKIECTDNLIIKQKTKKMEEIARQYFFHLDIIYINGKRLRSLFQALKEIKKKASLFNSKIIFSQNYYNSFIGFLLKRFLNNVYLHINLRGVPAEEELVYSDSFFLKRLLNFFTLKLMEKIIISGSDSISVVSSQHKKYLKDKFKIGKKPIIVYPCAYNSNQFYIDKSLRKLFREKFRIAGSQKVFIYSGSMSKYQLPFEIFQFYANMSKQDHNRNCVFIFLTFDKKKALNLAKIFTIHNLIIESVYEKDLLGFYNASDLGIICRKFDIVNRIASPTKIAEYLSTGNGIIMTEGIGDYSEDLRDKKFAIVKKDLYSFINTDLKEIMNMCPPDEKDLAWIKKNYSNDKIKIFNKILS